MRKVLMLLIVPALFIMAGCVRLPVSDTRFLMGTEITISIYAKSHKLKSSLLYVAIDSAFAEIERIQYLAHWDELNKLNAYAGTGESYMITRELCDLINRAYDITEQTNGAFRPDLGPLISEWGFNTKQQYVPEQRTIDSLLAVVDQTVFMEGDSGFASLIPAGARLNLDGIAKGYAVDRACYILQTLGVTAGIVEAGGDLRCFGTKPGGKKWRIGIRHPRKEDEFYTVIKIDSGAVATSGDYENYFELDGVRYHHILDPLTGYPSQKSVSSTVVAPTCEAADAYATAFFVMGPKEGVEAAEALGVEALIIRQAGGGKLIARETKGFKQLEEPDARGEEE